MPMNNPMPPMGGNEMGNDPMMGNEPMGDGMEEPMMDDDMDNENDPKKEIQKLSGKLSQELRNYNNDQETPDTDLNKYVAGMIIPQATKSMTSDEKAEVINKIKNEGFIIVARIFCFEDSVAPQRLNAYVYEDVEKTKVVTIPNNLKNHHTKGFYHLIKNHK